MTIDNVYKSYRIGDPTIVYTASDHLTFDYLKCNGAFSSRTAARDNVVVLSMQGALSINTATDVLTLGSTNPTFIGKYWVGYLH